MGSDTILVVGNSDGKLTPLLTKLGYQVIASGKEGNIPEIAATRIIDLILLDSRGYEDVEGLIEYFQTDESTRQIPMVVIPQRGKTLNSSVVESAGNVDILEGSASIGIVASRIATQLRLRKFAGQDPLKASIAEMNASLRDLNERFRREREQARTIQLSLLPRELPTSDKYEMAVVYEPLEEVGGDWYFVSALPGNRISLLIADVTGHGLSAAFIGSMTKLALSAANRESPSELLKEVNRLMAPLLPEGRFITMASALYDSTNGALKFARAGHPSGILLSRERKKVEELKSEGFAVGFFEEGDYQLSQTRLGVSDIFVLITDGISEAQNRDRVAYGTERISKTLLGSAPSMSAKGILDLIIADFKEFSEGRIVKDDYTILVLKRVK